MVGHEGLTPTSDPTIVFPEVSDFHTLAEFIIKKPYITQNPAERMAEGASGEIWEQAKEVVEFCGQIYKVNPDTKRAQIDFAKPPSIVTQHDVDLMRTPLAYHIFDNSNALLQSLIKENRAQRGFPDGKSTKVIAGRFWFETQKIGSIYQVLKYDSPDLYEEDGKIKAIEMHLVEERNDHIETISIDEALSELRRKGAKQTEFQYNQQLVPFMEARPSIVDGTKIRWYFKGCTPQVH